MSRKRALLADLAAAKRAGWSAMEWVPPRVSSNDIGSDVVDDDKLRMEVDDDENDDGVKAVAEEARSNDSSGAVLVSFILLGLLLGDDTIRRQKIVSGSIIEVQDECIRQIFICISVRGGEGREIEVGMKFC